MSKGPRHPFDDCIYSRTITDGQITWPYFFCFRSHRLIVESGSTPTCVAESCTAQLSSQRTTELPVCCSYLTSIAPLPSFLSSLSLLRLQQRRRFVRIVPTDQIPHDFRRICNLRLVNQLSNYTLKFICFGNVSHNFITKSQDWEPQLSASLGPLPLYIKESCVNPLTPHLVMTLTLKPHFLAFSVRYCRRLFLSYIRAHQRSFFLRVQLVDKLHASW